MLYLAIITIIRVTKRKCVSACNYAPVHVLSLTFIEKHVFFFHVKTKSCFMLHCEYSGNVVIIRV